MNVSHLGKMGDLVYCLPVIKSLARTSGKKVTLVTSALVYQLVPLLEEQPYIQSVEVISGAARLGDNGCFEDWAVLKNGVNLSPQPAMYRPRSPVPWTLAYAEIAGVTELTLRDYVALPSLWNHRQWFWEQEVTFEGKGSWRPPRTAILAPESETLRTIPADYWVKVAKALCRDFSVVVVGCRPDPSFSGIPGVVDLRGLTTVPTIARMMAEAHVVISANSLPWHLARHAGTPTFLFQDQYLERCTPVDTPFRQYRAGDWEKMAEEALWLADKPQTTLWDAGKLRELQEAA